MGGLLLGLAAVVEDDGGHVLGGTGHRRLVGIFALTACEMPCGVESDCGVQHRRPRRLALDYDGLNNDG